MDSNKIDVFYSAHAFQAEDLRDKTAIVVDVLRATSSIVTAIHNGAKGVVAVEDMGDASKIAQHLDSSGYLLCGEKDGVKIEGYQLGNSPLEYTRSKVEGKTLILNTTNGTRAITRASLANNILIASFLNLKYVEQAIKDTKEDIVIVCAGWRGRLSLEDMLCAGKLVYDLTNGTLKEHASDGARAALSLFEKYGDDITSTVKQTNHAVRLKDIVDEDDVTYCCQLNTCAVVPVMKDGIIRELNG